VTQLQPDAADIAGFLAALDEFAAPLDPSEQLALRRVLFAALDPIERMRWGGALLDEDELRVVESLSDPAR